MKFNLANYVMFLNKTMKIKDLLNSAQGLQSLQQEKLNVSVAFKIGKVMKQVNSEMEIYDKIRIKKITELGEEILDDGKPTGQFKVKEENTKLWADEYEKLIDQNVEISVPEITLAELGDVKIAPATLVNLSWLVKEV